MGNVRTWTQTPALALAAAAIAPAALLAVLGGPALTGRFYLFDDTAWFTLPAKLAYWRALQRGDVPVWLPDLFTGYYIHGEGQIGVLHPLNLALYRALPFAAALGVDLLFRYVFGLAGAYLFFRRWGLSRAAAAYGGACFAFCAHQLLRYPHLGSVLVTEHVPWLLLAADVLARGAARRAAWVSLAGLTASQLLVVYYPSVVLSVTAEVVYLAAVAGPAWRAWAGYAAAKGVGLLTAAVQVVATWELMRHAPRPVRDPAFVTEGSLHPYNLVHLISPLFWSGGAYPDSARLGQHEQVIYNGTVPLLLSLYTLSRFRSLAADRRRLAAAAAVLVAVGFAVAAGRHAWTGRVYYGLPVVGWFRIPIRQLFLTQTGMAVLAALAVDDWLAGRSGDSRRVPVVFWALPVVAVAVAVAGLAMRDRVDPPTPIAIRPANLALGLATTLTAVGLAFAAWRGVRVAAALLIAFSLLDQTWRPVRHLLIERPGSPPPVSSVDDVRRHLRPWPGAPGDRVFDWLSNDPVLFGQGNVSGYAGLFPSKQLDYGEAEPSPPALRVAGARWAYSKARRVWEPVPDPLPFARLVSDVRATDDPRRALPGIDPERTALVDRLPDPVPETGPPGEARLVGRSSGTIAVETESPAVRFLVIAESWYPGWVGEVDGKEVAVTRVYGDFLGCLVPAGRHRVVLRFRPWSLRAGGVASAVGLAVLLAVAVAPRGRRPPDGTVGGEPGS